MKFSKQHDLSRVMIVIAVLIGYAQVPAICFSQNYNDQYSVGQSRQNSAISPGSAYRNSITIQECPGRRKRVELRDGDEVWLVNARNSQCAPYDLSRLGVKKLHRSSWQPASLSELTFAHLADSSKETVIFIHGHRTDERWSITRGMQVYDSLFLGCKPSVPIRLVIWQWNSEREIAKPIQDYAIKSKRAIDLGKTLALTLDQFHNRDLTVIGYSLGAQTALSAVQQPEMERDVEGPGYRVALIATALDCNFAFSRYLGTASPVDQTIVFYNRQDRGVNLSELICKRQNGKKYVSTIQVIKSQAICLGQLRSIEIGDEVGKRHSIRRYVESPTLQNAILDLISTSYQHCISCVSEPFRGSQNGLDAGPRINVLSKANQLPGHYWVDDPVELVEPASEPGEYFHQHIETDLRIELPKSPRSSRRSAEFLTPLSL